MRHVITLLLFAILAALLEATTIYVNASSNNDLPGCGQNWLQACPTLQAGVEVACQNQSASGGILLQVAPGQYVQSQTLEITCPLSIQSVQGSQYTTILFEGAIGAGIRWNSSDGSRNTSMSGFTLEHSVKKLLLDPTIVVIGNYHYFELRDLAWRHLTYGSMLNFYSNSTTLLHLTQWSVSNCSFADSPVFVEGVDHATVEGLNWYSVRPADYSGGRFDGLLGIYAKSSVTVLNSTWSNCGQGNQVCYLSAPRVEMSHVTLSNVNLFTHGLLISNVTQDFLVDNFTCVQSSFEQSALEFDPQASGNRNVTLQNVVFKSNQCPSLMDSYSMSLTIRNMEMEANTCHNCLKIAESDVNIRDSLFTSQQAQSVLYLQHCNFSIERATLELTQISNSGNAISFRSSNGYISNSALISNYGDSTAGVLYSLDGALTITQSNITSNFVTDSSVLFHIGSILNISQSNFLDNQVGEGVIYVNSAVLEVSDSVINHNTAFSYGPALALFKAEALLSSVEASNNYASTTGGAIWMEAGALRVVDSVFKNNWADTLGGAIWQRGGALSVTDTLFEGNLARSSGGAIYATYGQCTLAGSTFKGNRAHAIGGDISAPWGHTVIVNDSSFHDSAAILAGSVWMGQNTTFHVARSNWSSSFADFGGAIMMNGTEATISQGSVRISDIRCDNMIHLDIQFNNCTAKLGGAIFLVGDTDLNMSNSTIQSCIASLAGGAFSINDNASMSLEFTAISRVGAKTGGAFYVIQSARVNLTQSLVTRSTAELAGGGFYIGNQARFWMKSSYLQNNTAVVRGGALCASGEAQIAIEDSVISDNRAGDGGGLSCVGDTHGVGVRLTINNSALDENYASSEGSAIVLKGATECSMTDSRCSNNKALLSGGCLSASGHCSLVGSNNTVDSNNAQVGGGYYLHGDQVDWNETNSHFEGNGATNGAGVYLTDQSAVWVTGCVFESNVVSGSGGALYLSTNRSTTSFLIANSTFSHNQAQRGGGVYTAALTDVNHFNNCFWNENTAADFGAAMYLEECDPTTFPLASNSSFAKNTAGYGGCNMGCYTASNTQLSAGDFCTGCIYGDPIPNYEGYQTDVYQTATVPTGIRSSLAQSSQSIYLDQPNATLALSLHDAFNSTVKGNYLDRYPYQIQANWPYGVSSSIDSWTITSSNYSIYPEVMFCGSDQQVFDIAFNATSQGQATFEASLAVKLNGCSKANHSPKPGYPCASCRLNLQIVFLIFVLAVVVVLVSLSVCCGLFVVARRAIKRHKLRSMQVPDLSRGDYSLEDLLSDDSIAKLNWSDIEFDVVLGKGASGLVRKAIWREKGKSLSIATKELMLIEEHADNAEVVQEFCKEIKYMSSLHHPNIVSVIGIIISPDYSNVYLASELMERGSVHDLLTKKGENIPMALRFRIAIDAAEGMNFIHSKKVIHRDLKSHNLLVNAEWQTKIADFGISTINPTITRKMTCIGTPTYMAPEVLQKDAYSSRADVYSFGIVLCELFTGRPPYSNPPFGEMSMAVLTHHILEMNARPSIEDLHPTLQNLVEECWAKDPYSRPCLQKFLLASHD